MAESTFVGQRVDASIPSDSDHNAILFSFTHGQQGRVNLLSWNIGCQYGFNEQWGFPFDGFCRLSESDADYIQRLDRTVAEVKRLAESYNPEAILLQECAEPLEFAHGVIPDQLEDLLAPLGYVILHEGEFVTAVRGLPEQHMTVELPKLRRQSGKIHAVHSDKLDCILLNVHLHWDQLNSENEVSTREDLVLVITHLRTLYPASPICLAGDTNRVPVGLLPHEQTDPDAATIESLVEGLGLLSRPPGPTNVRWSGAAKGSEMTFADFALWVPSEPAL